MLWTTRVSPVLRLAALGLLARRVQALLLAGLSTLVVASGVFAPVFSRAVDQGVFLFQTRSGGELSRTVVAEASGELGGSISAAVIDRVMPAGLTEFLGAPRHMWSGRVRVEGGRLGALHGSVLAQPDTCVGLTLVSGRCPVAGFEVAVSEADAAANAWSPGSTVLAREDRGSEITPDFDPPMVVVGVYAVDVQASHWPWVLLTGSSGVVEPGQNVVGADAFVTSVATFERAAAAGAGASTRGWVNPRLTATFALNTGTAGLDDLPAIADGISRAQAAGRQASPEVAVRSGLPDVGQEVALGQVQSRLVVFFLVAQLALLAVAVVILVSGAAAAQRRPEIGLARLRGYSGPQARMVTGVELMLPVGIGVPCGIIVGLAVARSGALAVLPQGVPWEVPIAALPLGVLGGLVCAVAAWFASRSASREPIDRLLRRVAVRQVALRTGIIDVLVVGAALSAVVALESGGSTGALSLVTPTLLAIAVGLMAGWLVVPLASWAAGRARRAGRPVGALVALSVARRPLLRRVVTVTIVATALTVFAGLALLTGAENRDRRARTETGAAVVAHTDAHDIAVVRSALATVPRTGDKPIGTPVVWLMQGSPQALRTMAVIPDELAQVADLAVRPEAFPFDLLNAPLVEPPRVKGSIVTVALSSTMVKIDNAVDAYPSGLGPETPMVLTARVLDGEGTLATVTLGPVPIGDTGAQTLTAGVPCRSGCTIVGLGVDQTVADPRYLSGTIRLTSMSSPDGGQADLAAPGVWPSSSSQTGTSVSRDASGALTLWFRSERTGASVTSTLVSAAIPALVATEPGEPTLGPRQGAGLDGLEMRLVDVATIPYAPGGGSNVAIVNLNTLQARGNLVASTGRVDIFLSEPDRLDEVTHALKEARVTVTHAQTPDELRVRYEQAAPAWSLSLAPLTAGAAVLMALLVMAVVVAADWRSRRHDDASLTVAGVPRRWLTRAVRSGYLCLIAAAVLLGTLAGLAGSWLALPLLPLFARPSTAYQVDWTFHPGVVVALVAPLILLFTGVAWLLAHLQTRDIRAVDARDLG
jgi:putative ABC transport system permease protein